MSFLFETIPHRLIAFQVVEVTENDYGYKLFVLNGGSEIFRDKVAGWMDAEEGDYIVFNKENDVFRLSKADFEAKYREVSA